MKYNIFKDWHLRFFVTPKCNLKCKYCNPEGIYENKKIIDLQSSFRVFEACHSLGITKVHFTGGEPTTRNDLIDLIKFCSISGFKDISMTTNGTQFFNSQIYQLSQAGLNRINISLDTLCKEEYLQICGVDRLSTVLNTIEKSVQLFSSVKINCVIMNSKLSNIIKLINYIKSFEKRNLSLKLITIMPCNPIMIKDEGQKLYHHEIVKEEQLINFLKSNFNVQYTSRLVEGVNPNTKHILVDQIPVEYLSMPSWKFKCAGENCKKLRLSPYGDLSICLNDSPINILKNSQLEIKRLIEEKIYTKNIILDHSRKHFYDKVGYVRFGNTYGNTNLDSFLKKEDCGNAH